MNWKYPSPYQLQGARNLIFAKGSWGSTLHDDFQVQHGDIVATEHWASSGFPNTDLEHQLKRYGKEKIIVVGLIANTCIEATARIGRGYPRVSTGSMKERITLGALDNQSLECASSSTPPPSSAASIAAAFSAATRVEPETRVVAPARPFMAVLRTVVDEQQQARPPRCRRAGLVMHGSRSRSNEDPRRSPPARAPATHVR